MYQHLPSGRLRSSHAHELVAAYFGYGTAAALQTEIEFPLSEIEQASILIPDVARMDQRRKKLKKLPLELPSSAELARHVSAYLVQAKYFNGEIWDGMHLSDDINGYVQSHSTLIEDDLSGEIASTNAYFDELYIDEYEIQIDEDGFSANLTGSLNGQQDEDRPFHGTTIDFVSTMTMDRCAARNAYHAPVFETGGAVAETEYYEDPEFA